MHPICHVTRTFLTLFCHVTRTFLTLELVELEEWTLEDEEDIQLMKGFYPRGGKEDEEMSMWLKRMEVGLTEEDFAELLSGMILNEEEEEEEEQELSGSSTVK